MVSFRFSLDDLWIMTVIETMKVRNGLKMTTIHWGKIA